jgi:hypothetical protein
MKTQYTPGPWHRNIKANGKYPTVFAGRNQHVAVVSQQQTGEETEANIDLIAAAPTLATRIQGALDCLSQNKAFPADIEQAKYLLADALKTAGIDPLPLSRE